MEVADPQTHDYDAGDFLPLLVGRCGATLRATAAAVMLDAGNGLELAATTGPHTDDLRQWELEHGQGPCLDAYRRRTGVLVADLASEAARWPGFVARAVARGIRAAFAFPLLNGEDCIGVLCVYREQRGVLGADLVRAGQAFADVAVAGVLQDRRIVSAEERAAQLQHALDSRVVIEQAKGILVERHKLAPDDAFDVLRRTARTHRSKIHDVARRLIDHGRLEE